MGTCVIIFHKKIKEIDHAGFYDNNLCWSAKQKTYLTYPVIYWFCMYKMDHQWLMAEMDHH